MSTMTIHGRWYAVEGILAVAAIVLCLAILLPNDSPYSEESISGSSSQTEHTRRGVRLSGIDSVDSVTLAERIAFNTDVDIEKRRVRSDAEIRVSGDGTRPYSDGRNRAE